MNVNTQTLETTPRNAQAAVSTPTEIELVSLVSEVARRKSKDGFTFSGTKGKSTLFSAVCSAYRSLRGLPKFTEDGKPARLSDSVVSELNQAIERFWTNKALEIVNYGTVVSYRKDVSAMKLDKNGEAELYLTSTMKAKRRCADISELHRTAGLQLEKAKKRMDYMLDNAGKFDRDEMDEQRIKISALERALELKELPKFE